MAKDFSILQKFVIYNEAFKAIDFESSKLMRAAMQQPILTHYSTIFFLMNFFRRIKICVGAARWG